MQVEDGFRIGAVYRPKVAADVAANLTRNNPFRFPAHLILLLMKITNFAFELARVEQVPSLTHFFVK
jgi:hypothetical protein